MTAAIATRPTDLYRLFDAAKNLLYVGITLNLGERWRTHSGEKVDWALVASAGIEHFPNRADALAAEKAAIKAEHPLWNVVHNRTHRVPTVRPAPTGDLDGFVWESLEGELEQIGAIADHATRAKACGEMLAKLAVLQMVLREKRQAAVLEMKATMSYSEVAAELGLHRNRVQQIAEGR